MKYVLLNSGGIESYMLAKHFDSILVDGVDELHSLYINFQLPNDAFARECAKNTADKFCSSHTLLNTNLYAIGWVQPKITPMYFDTATNGYVSYYSLSEEQKSAYDVNRLIAYPYLRKKLILEGMAFARAIGADVVTGGQAFAVSQAWADQFAAFINESELNWTSLAKQVVVEIPFGGMTVHQIMTFTGTSLIELEETVSCQEAVPCGLCQPCKKRIELGLMANE